MAHLFGSRVAFRENKHKVFPIEYNLLFGVDAGVILNGSKSKACSNIIPVTVLSPANPLPYVMHAYKCSSDPLFQLSCSKEAKCFAARTSSFLMLIVLSAIFGLGTIDVTRH